MELKLSPDLRTISGLDLGRGAYERSVRVELILALLQKPAGQDRGTYGWSYLASFRIIKRDGVLVNGMRIPNFY